MIKQKYNTIQSKIVYLYIGPTHQRIPCTLLFNLATVGFTGSNIRINDMN